ncbi:MAG: RNA chaperone ProQ [Holosporales bacterium]
MSLEKKKTLTIKVIPDHIKKLQELKTQIVEKENIEEHNKKVPIYQKPVYKTSMEWLYTTFPKCFTQREQRPLKISIFEDIVAYIEALPEDAEKPSKRGIRLALATYARNRYYLKACVEGAARIDLQGQDVETVKANEAEYALNMFKKYHIVFKEKKRKEKMEKRHAFKRDPNKPAGDRPRKPFNKEKTFNKDVNKDANCVRNFTYN